MGRPLLRWIAGLLLAMTSEGVMSRQHVIYQNQFAVQVPRGAAAADQVAVKHGFVNLGQIGSLPGYFLFEHSHVHKRSMSPGDSHHAKLSSEPENLVQGEGDESEMHEDTQETPEERGFPASASITTTNAEAQAEIIHVENTESANQSTPKQSKPTNVFRAPQSRKRKMVHDISAVIDKLDKVVQSNNKNETENEFDIFAKYLAAQLKQMPLYDAIICQEQIQTVLRQKRLELIMKQSQYTNPSPVLSPSPSTTPSPACSNSMDGEYWLSSFETDSNNKQQQEEESEQTTDILAKALNSFLQ